MLAIYSYPEIQSTVENRELYNIISSVDGRTIPSIFRNSATQLNLSI